MNPELNKIHALFREYVSKIIPLKSINGFDISNSENALSRCIVKEEGEFLYNYLHNRTIKSVLEIGTYIGLSTAYMATALQKTNGNMITIDPNQPYACIDCPQTWAKQILKDLGLNNVIFIEGYANKQTPINPEPEKKLYIDNKLIIITNVLNSFVEKKFDLIFIDGYHSQEEVITNFEYCINLLNKNGTIILHDSKQVKDVKQAIIYLNIKYSDKFYYNYINTERGLGIFTKKENDK